MKVTAWNNGEYHATGAGYGISITIGDRDHHFVRSWGFVDVLLGNTGNTARANIDKDGFWDTDDDPATCVHLIKKEIGQWMISQGHGTWPQDKPPKFNLNSLGVVNGVHTFELTP